ncbi:MAG: hypothetical protein ABJG78_21230 [Cyclobacteriaceae bacterium]
MKKFIISAIWIAVASIIWSCADESDATLPQQENLFAANILQNSGSAMSRVRGSGFGGPLGAIYGNISGASGRTSGSPLKMIRGAAAGRVATDSTDQTPECLTENWEDDGNGNYTYTLDFGDGCDYFGEFMKGKLVETGTYSESSFSSTSTYTEFGGNDWSIDGTYSYSGTWEDTSDTQPANGEDSIFSYNASYNFEADLTEQYTVYGHHDSTEVSTGETTVIVDYVATGSESMDENSYTVNSRTETTSMSTGESFSSKVDTPLKMDYTCENETWVFVSGMESGSYTYEGETGTYSIDYGDGTCDNLISLTENGVTEEIDLGDAWDDWEEECGDNG